LGDSGQVGDTPCFVVTHNKPSTSYPPVYTFVTDGVVSAIEQAKRVAGDKVVGLHGATIMQQALPLGLVDEIRVHVIPVLLGGGTPLFDRLDSAITLERTQVLVTLPRGTWDFGGPVSRSGRDQARRIQGRGDAAPADDSRRLPSAQRRSLLRVPAAPLLDQRGDRGVEKSEPAPAPDLPAARKRIDHRYLPRRMRTAGASGDTP
jgi:hypothetical protein